MRGSIVAFLAVCLWSCAAAAAQTPLDFYLAGEFSQAEAAGVAQNDSQGFAIAARAVLADDMMREQPCLDCLKRAEDLARRAIAADPKLPEGHIYLAAAVGYESRIIGNIAAQSKGYANQAKRELDAALATDPNNPWALAAMGSWHIEIVRSAGATLARWLFGAKFDEGKDYYSKAFAAAPGNLVIRYQYALALAAYNLADYQKDIESELTRAAADTASSTYETFARARARELLETLKRGDTAAAQRLVRRDQGYPG
jgi:tetratricopeptide (TPR) repeat protein